MLGPVLLAAAGSDRIRRLVSSASLTRPVVDRFIAGDQVSDALDTTRTLLDQGMTVTLDRLGESVTDPAQAVRNRDGYLELLDELTGHGLAERAELSVKLSAFGQALPDGHDIARRHVERVVAAATEAGTAVTLDMEDHRTVDSTLAIHRELRRAYPRTGAVLQSYLFRSENDCRELAEAGARVRLVKGAYREPASVAYQRRSEVDLAYVRCLRLLMAGGGYPMVGTHDPRLVTVAEELAKREGRAFDAYEYQMLFGIRDAEQRRLTALGHRVRVYVPYGDDWYGYFMRRLAERPANLTFFARSLATRG
ncbi:proline dehydrogenase family protein [Streptomyces profundus]|uniref:proline dehydrogenase family protein n=1 Tax=Streptomyces profundus TaxID=2867410 RepID=UPI001D1605B0|nr:proline dehydrogenase family protein [Streptomyces sp. MA3_2.13]UED86825.1 proline dehydrogenase family protein [Streptomyces sp. MA3_2.13]